MKLSPGFKQMHKLGPKGTVVIEKEIRDQLGLEAGVQVFQELVGEQVVLTFFRPRPPGSAFGILAAAAERLGPHVRVRLATSGGGESAADKAWDEYARERYGREADAEGPAP